MGGHEAARKGPTPVSPLPAAAATARIDATPADAAVDRLRQECARFVELEQLRVERPLDTLHRTAVAMHAFATCVTACEHLGLTRDTLLPHLGAVRALHARSPLVHRLQAWPR